MGGDERACGNASSKTDEGKAEKSQGFHFTLTYTAKTPFLSDILYLNLLARMRVYSQLVFGTRYLISSFSVLLA